MRPTFLITLLMPLATIAGVGDDSSWRQSPGDGGGLALSALWFLAIPLLFWMCANIPMVWVTAGITGFIFLLGGLSSGGFPLFGGLLLLSAAAYGYLRERADEKNAASRHHGK